MNMEIRTADRIVAAMLTGILAAGCTSELTRNASPVELLVTNAQNITQIDLQGGDRCDEDFGTVQLRTIIKDPLAPPSSFNDLRITRYAVSYERTDGGRTVPAPFTESIDVVLAPGTSSSVTRFILLRSDALFQAPFAALLPQNGGRDPDTGSTRVRMDIVLRVFGQTLAGENVSAATRMPMSFCFNCGGCG